jgi:hypothetical protein
MATKKQTKQTTTEKPTKKGKGKATASTPTEVAAVPTTDVQVPDSEPQTVVATDVPATTDSEMQATAPEEATAVAAAEELPATEGQAAAPEPETTVAKTPAETPAKKLSALDAAARVLKENGKPMSCQEMIGAMAAKGYWSSPAGKTPAATLYSTILRELAVKGKESRFRKVGRGQFASTGVA